MICKIEARNYRIFTNIEQELLPFQILIGPNASGKSTLFDVVAFLSDFLRFRSANKAMRQRTDHFKNLTFQQKGGEIVLALELRLPDIICQKSGWTATQIRYEVTFGETS